MKRGEEMEMITLVLAGSNQNSDGAAVTSEVCPTIPGPHQSQEEGLEQETIRFSKVEGDNRCQPFPSSP